MNRIISTLLICATTARAEQACHRRIPIAIVGGGVAGYSAGLFCARAHVPSIIFAGPEPGGQILKAQFLENLPLFTGTGYEFITKLQEKVTELGVPTWDQAIVTCEPDISGSGYILTLDDGIQIHATAVIAATGATPKRLGVPGEDRFWARGVYTCAVCDGFAVSGKQAVIVGGGDVAVEHALHLAPRTKSVTILVRKGQMRAIAHMKNKLQELGNISIRYFTKVEEIIGDEHISALRIKDTQTDSEEILPCDGLFLAIGATPNSDWLKSCIIPDEHGYVSWTNPPTTATSAPGIFSAGEISDQRYRRADSAMAQGSEAACDAIEYVHRLTPAQ